MSTAHAEAIGMACSAALFLVIGALALRLRIRTGRNSQWLYAGPIIAVIALVVMTLNLGGTVIAGG